MLKLLVKLFTAYIVRITYSTYALINFTRLKTNWKYFRSTEALSDFLNLLRRRITCVYARNNTNIYTYTKKLTDGTHAFFTGY